MPDIIDPSYFKELALADHEMLCRNSSCNFNIKNGSYIINIWNWQYIINPHEETIEAVGDAELPHEYLNLFCIYYLLKQSDTGLSGEWISEKDLVGGATFFRGPHLVPTEFITNRFADDLQLLTTRCEQMGGVRLDMADISYRFTITPDIPVALLYWAGDEDFPAEAKILYDRSISDLLSLDIIFALAYGVCSRLGA